MRLPDPEVQPTMALWPDVAEAYGISRNTAYAMAKRYEETGGAEGIPVLRFGTRYRCPTAAIRRDLGIDAPIAGELQQAREHDAGLRIVGGAR